MSKSLETLHVATAALSGEIYVGRIGKAGDFFTSKVNRTNEVKKALIEHMLHDRPADWKGVAQKFSWDGGKTRYEIVVKRCSDPAEDDVPPEEPTP